MGKQQRLEGVRSMEQRGDATKGGGRVPHRHNPPHAHHKYTQTQPPTTKADDGNTPLTEAILYAESTGTLMGVTPVGRERAPFLAGSMEIGLAINAHGKIEKEGRTSSRKWPRHTLDGHDDKYQHLQGGGDTRVKRGVPTEKQLRYIRRQVKNPSQEEHVSFIQSLSHRTKQRKHGSISTRAREGRAARLRHQYDTIYPPSPPQLIHSERNDEIELPITRTAPSKEAGHEHKSSYNLSLYGDDEEGGVGERRSNLSLC